LKISSNKKSCKSHWNKTKHNARKKWFNHKKSLRKRKGKTMELKSVRVTLLRGKNHNEPFLFLRIYFYATKELRIPTRNTRKIQAVAPEKTSCFDEVHPFGEAKITGTPITIRNESATSAKRASWKNRSIKIGWNKRRALY